MLQIEATVGSLSSALPLRLLFSSFLFVIVSWQAIFRRAAKPWVLWSTKDLLSFSTTTSTFKHPQTMLPRANLAICHVESDPRFFAPLRSESVVISTKVTARFCASSTIPKSSSHASMVKRWHSLTMKTLKQGLLEQKKYFLGAFSLIICSPSTSAGHISFGNTLGISSTASFPDVIHSSALQQRSSPQMSCLCHWVHRTGFTYSGLPPWNTPPLCIRSPPFPQAAPTGKKIGAVAPK